MQSWISDQKDPRVFAVIFIPLILILVIVFSMTRSITKPLERSELSASSLSVKNITYRFGTTSGRIFVSGEISNSASADAGKTCLRVNLFDKQDKLIDSFVQGMDVSIVPAKGTARFRIVGETPARPEEIKKAEVLVERSRARGRWD